MLKDAIEIPVTILEQGMFHKPQSPPDADLSEENRRERIKEIMKKTNFDCPEAIDWDSFEKALISLIFGKPAKVPHFDFMQQIKYFFLFTQLFGT